MPSNTASAFQDSCSSAAAPFVGFQLHGLSSTNCSEGGARKGPVGVVLKVPYVNKGAEGTRTTASRSNGTSGGKQKQQGQQPS